MLVELVSGLAERDVEVHALLLGSGSFGAELADAGAQTSAIAAGRLRHPGSAGRAVSWLARRIGSASPDAVVAWSAKAQLYAAAARPFARARTRWVWWQHMIPPDRWLDRVATRLPADAIGCSSEAGRLAQERLSPHRPSFVAHPGIGTDDLPAVSREERRRALGIGDGEIAIGIVGRLQPWKGQDRVLDAVDRLAASGLQVRCLVIGGDAYGLDPAYADRIRGQAAASHARVDLLGHLDDPLPAVAALDVLVNASDPEPFGLVILEAMQLGVPVVAVASGGPLEILRHGESGWLIPDNSPAAIEAGLRELAGDEELRLRIGRAGRSRFETAFTRAHMTDAFLAGLRDTAQVGE
jgi:glycosyltransferase involved in cell wall biosynthesis